MDTNLTPGLMRSMLDAAHESVLETLAEAQQTREESRVARRHAAEARELVSGTVAVSLRLRQESLKARKARSTA